MPPKFDPSQVVDAASSLVPKIGPLGLSPKMICSRRSLMGMLIKRTEEKSLFPPLKNLRSSSATLSLEKMPERHEKEKGVNVQDLLRCRPFSDDDLRNNAPQVVTCNEYQREVAVSQSIARKQIDRVFTFDKTPHILMLQWDFTTDGYWNP